MERVIGVARGVAYLHCKSCLVLPMQFKLTITSSSAEIIVHSSAGDVSINNESRG